MDRKVKMSFKRLLPRLEARLSDALVKVHRSNMFATALPVLVDGGMSILPMGTLTHNVAIVTTD